MKTLFACLSAALVCVSAFGQGKLSFANDSNHLVYFSYDTAKMVAGDADLAGYGVHSTTIAQLEGAPTLSVSLWAGASSSILTRMTTTTSWSTEPGRWTPVSLTVNLPAGAPAYYQVQIYDSRAMNAVDCVGSQGLVCRTKCDLHGHSVGGFPSGTGRRGRAGPGNGWLRRNRGVCDNT